MSILKPIKVAIADDHPLFLKGFAGLIAENPRYKIAFTVSDGIHLTKAIEQHKPDVLFMDVRMPILDGIKATKLILSLYPEIKIIGLSMDEQTDFVEGMLHAGAVGYIGKDSEVEEITQAIEDVYNDGFHFNKIVTPRLLEKLGIKYNIKREPKIQINLTSREFEVLMLMCMDKSTKQIAVKLNISEPTVGKHRENMHRKTGTHTSNGLVSFAYKNGIIKTNK